MTIILKINFQREIDWEIVIIKNYAEELYLQSKSQSNISVIEGNSLANLSTWQKYQNILKAANGDFILFLNSTISYVEHVFFSILTFMKGKLLIIALLRPSKL